MSITLYIEEIDGCTDFQDITVEVADRTEQVTDYQLKHEWFSTQKETHQLGTDYIEFKRIEHFNLYDSKGKRIGHDRMYTYYSSLINTKTTNKGNGRIIMDIELEGISWSREFNNDFDNSLLSIDNGKAKTTEEIKKLDPVIWPYILKVLEFKSNHAGGSPLQAEAYKNRETNEDIDTFSSVARGLGSIIGYCKHPYAKAASTTLSTAATASKYLKKSEHADTLILNYIFKSIVSNKITGAIKV